MSRRSVAWNITAATREKFNYTRKAFSNQNQSTESKINKILWTINDPRCKKPRRRNPQRWGSNKEKPAIPNNRSFENKRSQHIDQNRKREHRISYRTETRELQFAAGRGRAPIHGPESPIPQNLTRHGQTVPTPAHHPHDSRQITTSRSNPIQPAPLNKLRTGTATKRGQGEGAHTARSACFPAFQYA